MKAFEKLVRERVSTALLGDSEEVRLANLRKLFRPRISANAKWVHELCHDAKLGAKFEDWLAVNLAKHGTQILKPGALLIAKPQMEDQFSCGVEQLTTISELARFLGLSAGELDWFADLKNRNPRSGPLQHYRYRWIPKRRGSLRLLMEPKEVLKLIQRKINSKILSKIPLHDAAHGFRANRSIRTFAESHVGKKAVLRMDLADFFPSVTLSRVRGIFRLAGYPIEVAEILAGLCTHSPPTNIFNGQNLSWHKRKILQMRHLPQGSPTSPALANLAAFRIDARLSGLAKKFNLHFTRYADDLAFSGEKIPTSFQTWICQVIVEEGFLLNPRKTCLMKSSRRQKLAGVVVNQHPNIDRRDFDELKAILHNCRKDGIESQDREQLGNQAFLDQLRGRVSAFQMINPKRGKKLLAIYKQVL